mgnify:CR=1 FL=1
MLELAIPLAPRQAMDNEGQGSMVAEQTTSDPVSTSHSSDAGGPSAEGGPSVSGDGPGINVIAVLCGFASGIALVIRAPITCGGLALATVLIQTADTLGNHGGGLYVNRFDPMMDEFQRLRNRVDSAFWNMWHELTASSNIEVAESSNSTSRI